MGFQVQREDRVDVVGYAASCSANSVLTDMQSRYSTIKFEENESDVYACDNNVYKVTITIELA